MNNAFKQPDLGILIFRLGIGLMFIFHGYPKLFGGPEKWEAVGGAMKHIGITFMPAFWGFMAALSEFLGGILLIAGLAFRWTTAFMFFTMVIAFLKHYMEGSGAFKEWNHPAELAIVLLSFFFIGPGKYTFRLK